MVKYFSINEEGCSIRCKLYADEPRNIREITVCGHGFGGHKDNRATEKYAQKLLSKRKKAGVLSFDWPAHGDDGRSRLCLEDCDRYLELVIRHIREHLSAERVNGYATSFGGYLFLKYMDEHGNPFEKAVLRCPAVNIRDSLMQTIMTAQELEKVNSGKPVMVGFDRKVRIDRAFLDELASYDVFEHEYFDAADDILIIQGTKDEIIPFDLVKQFAEQNVIELIVAENADHRFSDPKIMDLAVANTIHFLWGS